MSLNDPTVPVIDTVADTMLDTAAATPVLAPEPMTQAIGGLPWRFSCFITGTDTEIGKTLVSSAILHKLVAGGVRACGMKPVAAGNVHLPRNITTPYMLRVAAAPHIAATLDGVTIEAVPILAAYAEIAAASDAVVVEGVGGFRVPLSSEFDSADLAAQLNLPVVLVVGLRLGCISHSLLTVEAIIARNLVLAGWVANEVDPDMEYVDENIEALTLRIPAPLIGRVPFMDQPSAAKAAAYITLAGLPGWPPARD